MSKIFKKKHSAGMVKTNKSNAGYTTQVTCMCGITSFASHQDKSNAIVKAIGKHDEHVESMG